MPVMKSQLAAPGNVEVSPLPSRAGPITKDGVEVKVGQVWKDLDVRMDGRHCVVDAVEGQTVLMRRCKPNDSALTTRRTRVQVARMHKNSTGWALVSTPTGEAKQEPVSPYKNQNGGFAS